MAIPILILIRHGEISYPKGILFGQLDYPLAIKGVEQMKLVADKIFHVSQKFNYPENSIIHFTSSDLTRCSASLDYILEVFHERSSISLEKYETKLLREYHLGEWEGQHVDDIKEHIFAFIENYKKDPWHAKPPCGESHYAVAHRIYPLVTELNSKYSQNLTISDLSTEKYEIHLWVLHEGSARMTMQLLNVETQFRTQNVEGEFIHGEHQLFFKRGDIIILKPIGIYKEHFKYGQCEAFPGSSIPDALSRSLNCLTAWGIIDHIPYF